MDLRLIYSIILSFLPISELRGGLPMAIVFAIDNQIPLFLIFSLIFLSNTLAIFIAFFFLDHMHKILLNKKIYQKLFEKYMDKFQKKMDKFEKKYSRWGFFALALFVAIPLPVTGAWSACILSWATGLDRKKSILAIAGGIFIAGIIVLVGTLGIKNLFF